MLNGLPDNTIYDIASDGFVWFATDMGICRYNGTTLRSFQPPTENKNVYRLMMTDDHYIWVMGLGGTMNCFDRRSERFMTIRNNVDKGAYMFQCRGQYIYTLTGDHITKSRIKYVRDSSVVCLEMVKRYDVVMEANEWFHSMAVDEDGTIYGITVLNRLVRIDSRTSAQHTTRLSIKDSHVADRIPLVARINIIGNSLWIATLNGGVIRYFKDTGRYVQVHSVAGPEDMEPDSHVSRLKLTHSGVYATTRIDDSRYIVATWNGYSELFFDEQDRNLINIKNYSNSYSELHQTLESRIISIHLDKNRILWMGTYGGGVYCSDLREQFYSQYHQQTSNEVSQMAFDNDGYLWTSSFYKGIQRSEKPFVKDEAMSFRSVMAKEDILEEQPAMPICSDSRGRIWAGSARNSLIFFESDGRTYKEFKLPDRYKKTIRAICSDNQRSLWIGLVDRLVLFDTKTQQIYPHIEMEEGVVINSLTHTDNEILYINTSRGFIKYNYSDRSTKRYCQSMNIITSAEDYKGVLYVGTTNGFVVCNSEKDSIKYFDTSKGLPNNYVACVVINKKSEVWLGNNSGISRFVPEQELFYNYYIQGNNRSAVMARCGTLLWSNNKSISYFDPHALSTLLEQIPNQPIVISDIEIGADIVSVGDTINNQVILRQAIQYTDHIELNADNNNFSLHVSNLLFNSAYHNYDYRLLPIQKEWITVKHGERISYAALPAGKYTFQVRGHSTQSAGIPITELGITIRNYWFFSWWIKALLFLIISLAVVFSFIRFRRRYNHKLYISKLRGELNVQRLELENERQINKDRVNFFTYASHELRTPLTLVLSPLQELLSDTEIDGRVRNRIQIAERNASQLLKLASKLLYLQKIEAKMVDLNITHVDVWSLICVVADSLDVVAKENGMRIVTQNLTQTECLYAYVDFDKIKSVLTNLISNSIKYRTEVEPQVVVSIEEQMSQDIRFLVITVRDNGQGIAKEKQKTIFESFTTDNNRPVFSDKTGIGLFIVRSIVESHHGKVTLESDKGQGATFRLYIPSDNYHFKTTPDIKTVIQSPVRQQTILVVEDNVEILDYICSLFEGDYRVLRATEGLKGLSIANEELPELIIHDVMLPDMSGIECCRVLHEKEHTSHIPVIILSAKSDEQTMIEGTIVGAADYLIKPFNPRILKAKVQALIKSRMALRQIYTKSLKLSSVELMNDSKSDNFIQKIINVTEKNLTNNEFSVDMLAQMLGMSTSTLRRNIKNHTTLSVNEIIRSVRLTKAASLLLDGEHRINEVAEMVGYNDISTFRAQFVKKFGISPSKFQSDGGKV